MAPRSSLFLLLIAISMTTQVRAEDPERQRLLAQIEKETTALTKEMDEKTSDLTPKQKDLQAKVAQREKTLRSNSRKGYYTKPSQDALRKLRTELGQVDEQIQERREPFLTRQEALEQRRRAVVKKYPEPGDPTYVDHQGKLLTQDEWTLEKSRDPRALAEEYIQELLRRGLIRSARYVNTDRHAESGERGLGARVVDFQNVNYTVQYVSKGGVLNERTAWVTLITGDGTHWIISRLMKETEILGGLP